MQWKLGEPQAPERERAVLQAELAAERKGPPVAALVQRARWVSAQAALVAQVQVGRAPELVVEVRALMAPEQVWAVRVPRHRGVQSAREALKALVPAEFGERPVLAREQVSLGRPVLGLGLEPVRQVSRALRVRLQPGTP